MAHHLPLNAIQLRPHDKSTARPVHAGRGQRGATLIELMVGMVIGMLAVLVIAQVAMFYEGQKRSTTTGSDAQVNGALAMQTVQRDVQMGGYGITSGLSAVGNTVGTTTVPFMPAAGCAIRAMLGSTVATEAPPRIAPVIIDDGANSAPDTVRVAFSGQGNFAVPIAVVPPAGAATVHVPAATAFVLRSAVNLGNSQGDLMMAVHVPADTTIAPSCTLFSLNMNGMNPLLRDAAGNETEDTANPLGTVADGTPLYEGAAPVGGVRIGPRLGHVADATSSGVWNGDGATPLFPLALDGPGPAGANAYLVNLGRPANFVYRSYSINTIGLAVRNFNATNGTATSQDLYAGIIDLQAVYGKALGTDPTQVTAWNAADPALDVLDSAGNTINGWSRVVAVRLALVARSQQYEKSEVTAVQPSWRPNGVDPVPLKIDGNADWKHYRYKIYETVVPLRNMIWQS